MAEEGKGKIEKFNGMNFQWWKMQVEDYLYQKDLYLPLVGEKPEAMNANDASRKTWIYAIKQKSDVYHTFKKWKALVEKKQGTR
ncbi:hypothetical protein RJ639_001606 [Escallonia herrerae]|uniref:Uncharacterized protein n=1 Tax=Escallonia herrerae TaxID=1293975 RepID=A0AA88XB17_9ASTE|nr:hypothetical protein RJ639_001606 [Escallonia herrerae]